MPGRLLVVALAVSGCSLGGYSQAEYSREADAARAELESAIGLALAEDQSACRVLSLGDRPCGGPAYFLAYSVTDADTARVQTLAARTGEIDRRANRALGLVSTCELRVAPPVEIRDGRCQFPVAVID